MPTYRTKERLVEAQRVSLLHHWAGTEWKRLPAWVRDAYEAGTLLFLNHPARIEVRQESGTVTADHGDLLVCDEGEIRPCPPEVFARTYEYVPEEGSPITEFLFKGTPFLGKDETKTALKWALEMMEMYEGRLVELGDPTELVHSEVHERARARAKELTK
jgi:hypothetical protein